jgi:signal transduction histidine kinase
VRLKLAHKITLLVMGVILALAGLSLAFLDFWTRRDVDRRLDEELVAASRVTAAVLRGRMERLQILCSSVADSPRFKASVEERDPATIRDVCRDERAVVKADLLLVTDRTGRVLADVGTAGVRPEDAQQARQGTDTWAIGDRLMHVATQPILYGTERAGMITLGQAAGDTVAREIEHLTHTGVLFLVAGRPAGTSLAALEAEAASAAARRARPATREVCAADVSETTVAGRPYKMVVLPVVDRTGRAIASTCLLRSLDRELAHLTTIQSSLVASAFAVALLALGLATVLARAITTPLALLMSSTRQVAAGRYDQPVTVRSSDEIGLLAERFDDMRASLKANIEKLVEEQRVKAQMEVERHRALSQMVAGVAHEINTPLGIVNQAASIVSETLSPEAIDQMARDGDARATLGDLVDAARLIQNNIARANTLIQTFKNLSVRQVSDLREQVDLGTLVAEIVSLFAIKAKLAHLTIDVEDGLAGQDRIWDGYPGMMSQVLMNLLTNVERYAYPGGEGGRVVIALAGELETFSLSVRDFGRGILPEHLPRLFEVFFTTGRDRGGSGLGLAIVHNLVTAALGGTIRVDSQPGQGTTFTVTVPRTVKDHPGAG